MCVQFPYIAPHLKLYVLKKINFLDFVRFKQCSRESLTFSENVTARLPLTVGCLDVYPDRSQFSLTFYPLHHNIPCVRIIHRNVAELMDANLMLVLEDTFIHRSPNDESYLELVSAFQALQATTPHLCIESAYNGCNLSTVHKITEVLSADYLTLMAGNTHFSYNNTHFPAFENLRSFEIEGEVTEDVVSILITKNLTVRLLEEILSAGFINNYLKNPPAQRLTFNISTRDFDEENDHILLKGLKYSVIWRAENHQESPLSFIDCSDFTYARACVVSNKNVHSLVYINELSFHMERLTGETMEEVTKNAWESLRKKLSS